MRMNRIYIAGPMRGYADKNFPAFVAAAELFRADGWQVENPVEIAAEVHGDNQDLAPTEYLRADLVRICGGCTAIALLPGWEASTGARAEVAVGITLGLDFYDALTMRPIDTPERVAICGGYDRPPGLVSAIEPASVSAFLNALRDMVHRANRKWWISVEDGVTPLKRNKGELIALMHSELSEALEGERKDLHDDKLPHRKMAEVEMVDAIIRILDYCGGFDYDVGGAFTEKMAFNATREDHTHEARKIAGGKQF